MFFWTLQSKSVLKEAEEKDIYYPNFELSPQSHINDYNRVLNAFNQLNHSNYKGLIFCLAPEQNSERINEYKNVEIIKQLFQNNTEIKNSLASQPYSLFDENHQLIKIDGSEFEKTHTIPIDYWNHIIIMDSGSPEYFDYIKKTCTNNYATMEYKDFEQCILKSIEEGKYADPIMDNSFYKFNTMTEIHIPYIRYSSILEFYDASQLLE